MALCPTADRDENGGRIPFLLFRMTASLVPGGKNGVTQPHIAPTPHPFRKANIPSLATVLSDL
eukprot:CAMPEP_0178714856 /NCGR_PEP_ID=MMETSP0699-20121125/20309_1 /TAXON_ID=265572 /ORGANISM="Extubocellulus spinifer, Strain CCMP396" /LENGTH=62 /DNA_ID=CAMNT_0020364043 /DNA_START=253 /DNA_END=441 /DNA_ORIENTATION=+